MNELWWGDEFGMVYFVSETRCGVEARKFKQGAVETQDGSMEQFEELSKIVVELLFGGSVGEPNAESMNCLGRFRQPV